MNMLISESKPLLPAVSELLRDGGMMIWSGILKEEREEAIEEALRIGCRLLEMSRRTSGGAEYS